MNHWKKTLVGTLFLSLLSACGTQNEPEVQSAVAAQHGDVPGRTKTPTQLVTASEPFGTPGQVGSQVEKYGLILLDRTGSMFTVRSTGNTRCYDALVQARSALAEFFDKKKGTKMAVWTFTDFSVTKLTSGYVDRTSALNAINSLDPNGCSGSTPLADALCWAIDDMKNQNPKPAHLHVATDGYENNSTGACSGPTGDYWDPTTWQGKVYNKLTSAPGVITQMQFWLTPTALQSRASGHVSAMSSCANTAQCEDQLFEAMAGISGGDYRRITDDDTAYPCTSPDTCPDPGTIYW